MFHRSTTQIYGLIWPLFFGATSLWLMVGLSPFATMCAVALSLFVLIKTHVLVAFEPDESVRFSDVVAWFLAWPGLDSKAFFHSTSNIPRVAVTDILFAVVKMGLGMVLFFVIAPRLVEWSALTAGWIAMLGAVFTLHFGSFHLLALYWRGHGRDVRPIMNAPIAATSVGEFWSKRWNLAFRDYAHPFLFKPLARKCSPVIAVAGGYVFSGTMHELVISVPAGSGFGLPTFYFALQGIAILAERKLSKAGIAIRSGLTGRCWTLLITAPAAFFLFHPPFVTEVIVPVVEYLGTGSTQ